MKMKTQDLKKNKHTQNSKLSWSHNILQRQHEGASPFEGSP